MSGLRIATRGSKLALWQAEHVKALLQREEPQLEVSLLVLKTTGDRIQDRPLYEVGGKGLFVKEIEEALLSNEADVAVHSMKDLPAAGPKELMLGAVPHREDPRDALLARPGLREAVAAQGLLGLPQGATLGTSSVRRVCQLRLVRPDLQIVPLRGNVDTRLRKLEGGEFDAMVLAMAGLSRLGYGPRIDAALPEDQSLPAVGQGALALQCRGADAATRRRLLRLTDPRAEVTTQAERAFLCHLGGDCRTPLAAHARLMDGVGPGGGAWLELRGLLADETGTRILRGEESGAPGEAEALGQRLAARLLAERG